MQNLSKQFLRESFKSESIWQGEGLLMGRNGDGMRLVCRLLRWSWFAKERIRERNMLKVLVQTRWNMESLSSSSDLPGSRRNAKKWDFWQRRKRMYLPHGCNHRWQAEEASWGELRWVRLRWFHCTKITQVLGGFPDDLTSWISPCQSNWRKKSSASRPERTLESSELSRLPHRHPLPSVTWGWEIWT